jgi:hypothetical protein
MNSDRKLKWRRSVRRRWLQVTGHAAIVVDKNKIVIRGSADLGYRLVEFHFGRGTVRVAYRQGAFHSESRSNRNLRSMLPYFHSATVRGPDESNSSCSWLPQGCEKIFETMICLVRRFCYWK